MTGTEYFPLHGCEGFPQNLLLLLWKETFHGNVLH